MITHIVMFRLREDCKGEIPRVVERLNALNGKIPQLRGLQAGADVLHSPRSYDLALVAQFDSLEDLNAYQVHPAHVEVANYIGTVRESAVAVDYES